MTKINPTPPVNCRYGAPMGRYTGPDFLDVDAGKIHLQRVRLDSGGYDSGGAYWGRGTPLWYAMDQDGNSRFFRAASRDAAKASILADFEGARFFR
jgi:hypothetical protein